MEVKKVTTATHFHSQFSNILNKNTAPTHSHMLVLSQFLMEKQNVPIEVGTIFDNRDGCTKQY